MSTIETTREDFDALRHLLESAADEILDRRYVDSMSGTLEIESFISLCESFLTIYGMMERFHESRGCVELVMPDIREKYKFAQSIR